jgi:hypothetical protein
LFYSRFWHIIAGVRLFQMKLYLSFLFFLVYTLTTTAQALFQADGTGDPTVVKECKTDKEGRKWLLKFQYGEAVWWSFFDVESLKKATIKKNTLQAKKEENLNENEVVYIYGEYEFFYRESINVKDSINAKKIADKNRIIFIPTISKNTGEFTFSIDSLSYSIGEVWSGCQGPKIQDTITTFNIKVKSKNDIIYNRLNFHEGVLTKEMLLNELNQPLLWSFKGNYFGISRFFYFSRGVDMVDNIYLFNF